MDEHYCLYGLTWANCPLGSFGSGVDPRFAVELVRCGRLAALPSRVGLDQFDLTKLQEGTADFSWLSKVAVRHNEIISAAARISPVLPMRLGIFFNSLSSLTAKLAPHEANTAEFLQYIEDRREWAVKIYLDEDRAERAIPADRASTKTRAPLQDYLPAQPYGRADRPHSPPVAPRAVKNASFFDRCVSEQKAYRPGEAAPGQEGRQYLAAKGLRLERRRQVDAVIRQAALTVEGCLQSIADAWHRLRPLTPALTNRAEKMVWNGAFLLSRTKIEAFHTACEQLRNELDSKGLIVDATGPWPAYHFCPSFEPEPEVSPCRCTC